MAIKDEKEPNYSKMSPKAIKKYGSKSPEEAAEVAGMSKRAIAAKVLKKKAKEGSAAEEKGESASYEKKEDQSK